VKAQNWAKFLYVASGSVAILLATDPELGNILVPVFITCDPRRDTPGIVHEYIQDFHPEMIGLTGSQEEITKVAKSFRVYVSSPPNVKEGEDYLVDHSIFFYLMDPEGKFVDCYAKDTTADEVASSFKKYALEYMKEGGKVMKAPRKKAQETYNLLK
jgi:protein SCO1/2